MRKVNFRLRLHYGNLDNLFSKKVYPISFSAFGTVSELLKDRKKK